MDKNFYKKLFYFLLIVLFFFLGYWAGKNNILETNRTSESYACKIKSSLSNIETSEGEKFTIPLKIKNLGNKTWNSRGRNPYYLSYHLLNEKEEIIKFDNPRFTLPKIVKPGQAIKMEVKLDAPIKTGRYILEFDMVREGVTWFKDKNSKTLKINLIVKESKWPEDKYEINLNYGKYTKYFSDYEELNKINKLIRITLKNNEIKFEGETGKVYGFGAGNLYPQIWLRDSATILPLIRYFYDIKYLTSWLEEHLAYQKENGSLYDWIDSNCLFDKNTTETDQESSAVQSAYQIVSIIGPNWLNKKIKGKKIIERLDNALSFVLKNRFNQKFGLVIGAHTADWGDVDIIDADNKAVYVDKRTIWTTDIYDQSMFHLACKNLSEMYKLLNLNQKANYWSKIAEYMKINTNKWLWQENKGFYRVHIHLTPLKHNFDEDNIFAMGGNAMAILSGLADENKTRRIIKVALERQKIFNVSTISGTLLPCYPKGFFKHPMMDDFYEYQNGGQWDWFGARLICAMYENGYSEIATQKLLELVKKNLNNENLFEWHSIDGIGKGSSFYLGSAGVLGRAIIEGYFGIKLSRNHLILAPKIGRNKAKIHVYQPANDLFVAYTYNFDNVNKRIIFKYNSNFPKKGEIRLLNPIKNRNLKVLMDGKEIIFKREKINLDEFIVLETNFQNHTIEIRFK
ncbi:hypothetical protein NLB96_00460 [Candidatus Aminicenantes bacterium AC-335-K20]|jgi:hypothetical protein|nr:hypothetical protein [SCandidatus Aminicenantes bacterium Aminicenantia_JdfR_composite]MCP2596559.1 hypothetical protein [Candidatus Aminicenantes bacterium AC-335-G13]MCP2598325.1 hypothetical protein [Candidatus Aminicenantes bacterium AC-335-L06]MCP2605435.1 hypothetical protein [Candidatus Aminicenantes bacterium AC-335-O07]MCP2606118.1 hypothetical protein [Candidatus Aminicenantes bacterium AC-708-I09]MCP2618244.1 hypothetical protein [Candidatus Aminicenantes bacterium AC-335-A11]MC